MKQRCAFTQIELLMVVFTIALLIAILLPALGASRRAAVNMMCQANLDGSVQWHDFSEFENATINILGAGAKYWWVEPE